MVIPLLGANSSRSARGAARNLLTQKKSEDFETRTLIEHAFSVSQTLSIGTLVVQADAVRDVRLVDRHRQDERIVWLVKKKLELELGPKDAFVTIPEGRISRIGSINIGLFLGTLSGALATDDSVLCLSGVSGSNRLDTLLIVNIERDYPEFSLRKITPGQPIVARWRDLARALEISIKLASEGREGKSIGTIFVLGDPKQLEPHLRQLILNPCAGHTRKARSIHNIDFLETIREYSALDGGFIVGPKGVIESAGTYLDAPARGLRLPAGLGARHSAAAAITRAAETMAIAISESSGNVTVFQGGKLLLQLDRPGRS